MIYLLSLKLELWDFLMCARAGWIGSVSLKHNFVPVVGIKVVPPRFCFLINRRLPVFHPLGVNTFPTQPQKWAFAPVSQHDSADSVQSLRDGAYCHGGSLPCI